MFKNVQFKTTIFIFPVYFSSDTFHKSFQNMPKQLMHYLSIVLRYNMSNYDNPELRYLSFKPSPYSNLKLSITFSP